MEIHTIGFTRRSAESFFETLRAAGVERVVDVRLKNTSGLAGFAKRDDLAYLLGAVLGADYVHERRLAPSEDLFEAYKRGKGPWEEYRHGYLELMAQRRIADEVPRDLFSGTTALLCSEHSHETCHRRLVVEYLDEHWGGVTAVHL